MKKPQISVPKSDPIFNFIAGMVSNYRHVMLQYNNID